MVHGVTKAPSQHKIPPAKIEDLRRMLTTQKTEAITASLHRIKAKFDSQKMVKENEQKIFLQRLQNVKSEAVGQGPVIVPSSSTTDQNLLAAQDVSSLPSQPTQLPIKSERESQNPIVQAEQQPLPQLQTQLQTQTDTQSSSGTLPQVPISIVQAETINE